MFGIFPKDTHRGTSLEFPASTGEEAKEDFLTIMQESLTDSELNFIFFFQLSNKFEDCSPSSTIYM